MLHQFYQHFIFEAALLINIPSLSLFCIWAQLSNFYWLYKFSSPNSRAVWCTQRANLFHICLFEIVQTLGDVQLYHCSLTNMFPNFLSPDPRLNLSFSGKLCWYRNLQFLQSSVHLQKSIKRHRKKNNSRCRWSLIIPFSLMKNVTILRSKLSTISIRDHLHILSAFQRRVEQIWVTYRDQHTCTTLGQTNRQVKLNLDKVFNLIHADIFSLNPWPEPSERAFFPTHLICC